MNDKDRLQVKLMMYSLLESRSFILHHYDQALAEAIVTRQGDTDRHGMLRFTLQSIVPFEGFDSLVVNQLISELLREVETFNTSELLVFAKERIPYYVDQLHSQLV